MNNKNKVVSIVFTVVLFFAGISYFIVPEKQYSVSERRFLQKFPSYSIENFRNGSFGKKYELWLEDHFPARDFFVGVNTAWLRLMGKKDINGVYFGKDQYLIQKFDSNYFQDDKLDENIQILAQFCNEMKMNEKIENIKMMLVPSASQILTEKLPKMAVEYDQGNVLKEVMEKLGENKDILVDITKNLKEHEKESIYYRTDHHWTTLGAYYGYESWAKESNLRPFTKDSFNRKIMCQDFSGTLSSKVNIKTPKDSIELWYPVKEQEYQIYYDEKPEERHHLYEEKYLRSHDPYSVFLDGNHAITRIHASGKGNLLIIKDSFANSLTPFLIDHFENTFLIDLRYYNDDIKKFIYEKNINNILILYQIPGIVGEKNIKKLKQ